MEKRVLFSSQVGLRAQRHDASISQALVRTLWWGGVTMTGTCGRKGSHFEIRSQRASGLRLAANDLPHRELRVPQEWYENLCPTCRETWTPRVKEETRLLPQHTN